jgi:hypothetical protein
MSDYVSAAMPASNRTALNHLKRFADLGLVRKIGAGRTTRYVERHDTFESRHLSRQIGGVGGMLVHAKEYPAKYPARLAGYDVLPI